MATSTLDTRLIPSIQYTTPLTGGTINVNAGGYVKLLINPAGSLLALTIALPAAPSNGDVLELASSQAITTLTMSGGTIVGPLTAMAIGTFASYVFSTDADEWFRIG